MTSSLIGRAGVIRICHDPSMIVQSYKVRVLSVSEDGSRLFVANSRTQKNEWFAVEDIYFDEESVKAADTTTT